MKQILITTIIFSALQSLAQTGSINGIVKSSTQTLEFALVGLKGANKNAYTDQNGKYKIQDIPYGDYELVATLLGFKPYSKQITLSKENPSIQEDILLEEQSQSLEEVVISGTMKEVSKSESPVPVEVYSEKFFKANPTPSVFESLQNINGVRPQLNCNVCNTGDIHINGLEGPYTMVLIDGMPIVSGLGTVYGLTGIPQSLIQRIEVVKGPASTLYGSEAVGGLINIITKQPSAAPLVSADVYTTTWLETNLDLGVKLKVKEKANSLIGINYFNYNNPIDNNGDNFTDVTLQDRISIFNKWDFNRKEKRVFTIAGRYLYEDRWGGEMQWTPEFRGGDSIYAESIYTSRWEAYSTYQLPTKEHLTLQISANGHYQNSVYGTTKYIADQKIFFSQLLWNKSLGKNHEFLVGLPYRYTYYDDNTFATSDSLGNNMPSKIHLPGVFVQDQIKLDPSNTLLLGLRYDYNSVHGNIFTPRINHKWQSKNKKNIVRIGAGTGYRVANVFTEDHAALTGARDVVFEGALEPETSWNVNLNYVKKIYTKKNQYFGLDGSIFYTHFENRILPDYETDPNKIIYANLDGYSVSKGVSLNVDGNLNNRLRGNLGATIMDVSIYEDGERFQQLLTESFTGVWSIEYTFGKSGITFNYTGNVYGPMRLPLLGPLDDRAATSPWWSIQNIQLRKHLKKGWEIYGGIKNLLNFTPPANSIARAHDPFDKNVQFGNDGQVIPTEENPNALTFDPSYVYAPNQGIRGFLGVRYTLKGK